MEAKLRSMYGPYRLEFKSEHGSGSIWLSELDNSGVVVIRIEGEGRFEIEDDTKEKK